MINIFYFHAFRTFNPGMGKYLKFRVWILPPVCTAVAAKIAWLVSTPWLAFHLRNNLLAWSTIVISKGYVRNCDKKYSVSFSSSRRIKNITYAYCITPVKSLYRWTSRRLIKSFFVFFSARKCQIKISGSIFAHEWCLFMDLLKLERTFLLIPYILSDRIQVPNVF